MTTLANEGDPCPKCKAPMAAEPGTMYFRGRYFAGIVCRKCNVMYDNAADSMFAFARTNPPHPF